MSPACHRNCETFKIHQMYFHELVQTYLQTIFLVSEIMNY